MGVLSYVSDWKAVVRDGLLSYCRAVNGLRKAREYSRSRYVGPSDEPPPISFPPITVPLLWGTF